MTQTVKHGTLRCVRHDTYRVYTYVGPPGGESLPVRRVGVAIVPRSKRS